MPRLEPKDRNRRRPARGAHLPDGHGTAPNEIREGNPVATLPIWCIQP